MNKKTIAFTDHYAAVIDALTSRGLLLGSYDAAGRANVMTIGWGSLGSIWGEPVWTVLVSPKRKTFRCIEHTGCFSVNVPTEAMGLACIRAGNGRVLEGDKFDAVGLTAEKGAAVLAPVVAECPIVYECRVLHGSDVLPNKLADDIAGLYVDGESHRIYFGRVLSARADADAAETLTQRL